MIVASENPALYDEYRSRFRGSGSVE